MLRMGATFLDQGKAQVAKPDGTVEEIDVMVMTVEVIGGAGEVQFITPLKAGAEGLAKLAQDFHRQVNAGLSVIEGPEAANAVLKNNGRAQ